MLKIGIKNIILGIRYLEPYWSVYGSHAKGRWVGRELNEVFVTEFLSNNKFYPVKIQLKQKNFFLNFQEAAIRAGRVFINGVQMTNPKYRIRPNDHLFHLGHRHEHPILAEPKIEFIGKSKISLKKRAYFLKLLKLSSN